MQSILTWVGTNDNLVLAITAILAIILSLISISLTYWTLRNQNQQNVQSVRPIGEIGMGNYEDRIYVSLRNVGLGPLIIDSVSISNGADVFDHTLIDLMPELEGGAAWSDYRGYMSGRALSAGAEITLIDLSGAPSDKLFIKNRNMIRKKLAPLTITLKYSDMYGNSKEEIENLTWFS